MADFKIKCMSIEPCEKPAIYYVKKKSYCRKHAEEETGIKINYRLKR